MRHVDTGKSFRPFQTIKSSLNLNGCLIWSRPKTYAPWNVLVQAKTYLLSPFHPFNKHDQDEHQGLMLRIKI